MTSQLLDKAPVWLEEAFEERVYWRADATCPRGWVSPVSSGKAIFQDPEDAIAFTRQFDGLVNIKAVRTTLEEALDVARRKFWTCVVLLDGQGNELKRWPVER